MGERIPQSTAITIPLKAYLASDHVTAATGETIGVVISKNGAAFANPSAGGTNATEIGLGWYSISLSAADTDSLGPLIVHGAASGVDDVEVVYDVVDAWTGGWAALPDAAAGAANGLAIVGSGMDLVNAPNTTAIAAFVAAVWQAAIATYSGVSASFGQMFSDKLAGISGQVAAQSDVQTLQNNTTISLSIPPAIQIPASGSTAYPITIYLRDSEGVMIDASSTPTVSVVDTSGASYASRLSAISNPATGKYAFTATINSTDVEMLLIWEVTATTSEGTQIIGGQSWVTLEVMAYFTSTDRSTLGAAASEATAAAAGATSLLSTIGAAGAGLTALPPVSLTSATHTAIASDTQTGLTAQGYTSARAGLLDTLSGLAAAVWSVATSAISSGVGQRILSFVGSSDYAAPPSASAIAAAVLKNAANPLATDSLGRVTVTPTQYGTGDVAWPLTIELATGDPLSNALVTVTSDAEGATIVAGPAATDANGRVVFSLDPGEYYRWATATGVSFSNPQSFTVTSP